MSEQETDEVVSLAQRALEAGNRLSRAALRCGRKRPRLSAMA